MSISILLNHLQLKNRGQFSTVYELIEKTTQTRWAGKVVNKLACPASALETELSILKILDHPQTVKIREVFSSDEVCIIVMELYVPLILLTLF